MPGPLVCGRIYRVMAEIGRLNALHILRATPQGLYLDGGDHGDILLPSRYVTEGMQEGDQLTVFVYRDSEDRLVAVTDRPLSMVGDFASLRVTSVHPKVGAFLDWGLSKDLLLPFREQPKPVRKGQLVVVHILLDPKSERIIATMRLHRWLDRQAPRYRRGQSVRLMVVDVTPMGWNALVNASHMGLLYHDATTTSLQSGDQVKGYILRMRDDGKIDLSLEPDRGARVVSLSSTLMEALERNQGFLPLNDKSSPEDIRTALGVSKKVFKQTIGNLLKTRQIVIEPNGIRCVEPS
ncbi:MAG: S1-like domain-containing RNA-binding protein [Verrucomicrobiota bacterium]|nr:S1-like domain-containing RNA-binding protein [Verrucomicrobiota bacterium]